MATSKALAESLAKVKKSKKKGGGGRKIGRNRVKCANYRARVGKPLGRGIEGNRHH